jgi:hypothetical protein
MLSTLELYTNGGEPFPRSCHRVGATLMANNAPMQWTEPAGKLLVVREPARRRLGPRAREVCVRCVHCVRLQGWGGGCPFARPPGTRGRLSTLPAPDDPHYMNPTCSNVSPSTLALSALSHLSSSVA